MGTDIFEMFAIFAEDRKMPVKTDLSELHALCGQREACGSNTISGILRSVRRR